MRLPAQGVHVHHSVTSVTTLRTDMLELERIGRARFGRFSYSYVGHPEGVAEGAGLTVGAHTAGWNSTTLGYCFAGNYEQRTLTGRQIDDFRSWLAHMIAIGALDRSAFVEPHQARKATECPGRYVIARWPDLLGPAHLEESEMFIAACPERNQNVLSDGVIRQEIIDTNHLVEIRKAGLRTVTISGRWYDALIDVDRLVKP
jgi:hypothetical protein